MAIVIGCANVYQTPRDNAWIESWFRILKHDELKYRDYFSFDQLKEIVDAFIHFYNTQRYHGAIGYVTPQQKHCGQAEEIIEARKNANKRPELKEYSFIELKPVKIGNGKRPEKSASTYSPGRIPSLQ